MSNPVISTLRRLNYFTPLRYMYLAHNTYFEEERVYSAEPSWENWLMGFGIGQRHIVINGNAGFIMITRKTWFLESLPRFVHFKEIEYFEIRYDNLIDAWLMASEMECYALHAKLHSGDSLMLLQWTGNFHHPKTELVAEVKARDTSAPRTEANVAFAICKSLLDGYRKTRSERMS